MGKRPRAKYTLEFKLEALRQIAAGQSVAVVSAVLGVSGNSLHSWVKAQREGCRCSAARCWSFRSPSSRSRRPRPK